MSSQGSRKIKSEPKNVSAIKITPMPDDQANRSLAESRVTIF